LADAGNKSTRTVGLPRTTQKRGLGGNKKKKKQWGSNLITKGGVKKNSPPVLDRKNINITGRGEESREEATGKHSKSPIKGSAKSSNNLNGRSKNLSIRELKLGKENSNG